MGKNKSGSVAPGANWLALKRKLPSKGPSTSKQSIKSNSRHPTAGFPRGPTSTRRSPPASPTLETSTSTLIPITNELKQLRDMVLGRVTAAEALETEPGRYLALDCEMVGVGEDGLESSLARASLVDFHGRIVLDEFVRQRERVVDYRTAVSGIRPQDMIHGKSKPFKDVQAKVAELLAPSDRILVGHALSNDLTALLLAHPASRTRDTQVYAGRKPAPVAQAKGKGKAVPTPNAKTELTLWEKYRSRRIGLKRLTKEELGLDIQGGEHSSITDARAAMAIYRLHKRAWDASLPVSHVRPPAPVGASKSNLDLGDNDGGTGAKSKRKRDESFPGGGRRGVSSGLGIIVRERTSRGSAIQDKPAKDAPRSSVSGTKWWQTLGEGGGRSKGKLRA